MLRSAGHDRGMDLMVATLQLAAVIKVRSAHAEGGGAIGNIRSVSNAEAVASRDRIAETYKISIRSAAIELGQLNIRQHPNADAIPVWRRCASPGMAAARLATVFDIHAEQDRPRLSPSARIDPIPHARKGDLVGGRPTRLGPSAGVGWIADSVQNRACAINPARPEVGVQAGANQSVKETGMEISIRSRV